MDGDGGDQYLLSGYHIVNRFGYLLSIDPCPTARTSRSSIPMQDEPLKPKDKPLNKGA